MTTADRASATAGESGRPGVRGRCPRGCGETLFVGHGGYVTCSWAHCPEPDAASRLLAGADTLLAGLTEIRRQLDLYAAEKR